MSERTMEPITVRCLPLPSTTRVEADVSGEPLWFESDVPLANHVEAYAAAFLLVSAHHGRPLVLDSPLSDRFRRNLGVIRPIIREFWKYNDVTVVEPESSPAKPLGLQAPRYRASALMFSGGVDSFYSMLRGPLAPDALVLVEGFDIPLANTGRSLRAWASLQQVATEMGMRSVRVTTNLREHALFRSVNWETTHGGALASVGHVLREQFSHILISSSNHYADADKPWGSHFRLDPLWSSESVAFLHVGATHKRSAKLLEIADEPIVQQHLRVCWEGTSESMNCGTCEKCVRTQLVLLSAGKLEPFATFNGNTASLTEAVRHINVVANHVTLKESYSTLGKSGLPSPLREEVALLVKRSARYHAKRAARQSWLGRTVQQLREVSRL
jgi:hypothetical protein